MAPEVILAVAGLFLAGLFIQAYQNRTMTCPECQKRVKVKATVCPYCAHRFAT